MKRVDFTHRVGLLLHQASLLAPCRPILDYVKRTDQGQAWLFKTKKSKKDGLNRRSKHQSGKAVDIYLVKNGRIAWARWRYLVLHNYWKKIGGRPMDPQDIFHFEV